jgi:cystathionine beta-synthase
VPALVFVEVDAPIRQAIELIKRYNISQLPVMREGEAVGCVEEGRLMSRVLEDAQALGERVSTVMEAPLPVIDGDCSVDDAIKHLATRNAIMVKGNGGPLGILTRFDLIEYVSV